MIETNFSIFKLGLSIYGRSFLKYKEFYIVPGVTLSFRKAHNLSKIDIELKILCFGIGVQLYKKK